MNETLAYLDWGRWVAGCPTCLDATMVYSREDDDGPIVRRDSGTCVNGHAFQIIMPSSADEKAIMTAVSSRPEAQQAWYPDGLPLAEDAGLPTGLTPDQLEQQTTAIIAEDGELSEEERAEQLRAALAAAGITVNADGTFAGQL